MDASTRLVRTQKEFKDISLNFEPSPIDGDLTKLKDRMSVQNSFKNIIFTRKGERPFDHSFGSHLYDYLFELTDNSTASLLMLEVERTIRLLEPRVNLHEVIVDPNLDANSFMATFIYTIIGYDEVYTTKMLLEPCRT